MIKTCAVLLGGLISLFASAQVRHSRLMIGPKESYELKGSDIIVVDTLVMKDSARLILNKLKPENYIHARTLIFHKGCVIDGKGAEGLRGRDGRSGSTPATPCSDGTRGQRGTDGTNGGRGTNLFLYYSNLQITGSLMIDVSGGNAGDGGDGGNGGGGGPGLRICPGGDGGAGSPGADGGNGGDAGQLSFVSAKSAEVRLLIGSKIFIRNYGGDLGLGGSGGAGGFAGLTSPGVKGIDGKAGKKGRKGNNGVPGKSGAILFEIK